MRRLGQVLLFFIAGICSSAILRWQLIRTNRKPAPNPYDLVRNPDNELSVSRQENSLKIEWQHHSTEATIYLGLSPDSIHSEPIATVKNTQSFILSEIDPTQRYFVEVRFEDGLCLSSAERFLPFKSIPNFRDIGGYKTKEGRRVRWNRIFRAASMDSVSDEDLARLENYNIQVVCDVRSTEEMLNHPDRILNNVTLISIPPHADDNPWIQLGRILFQRNFLETALYLLYTYVLIDHNQQMFAALFQRLADESNLPIIIHCAAGKDRTGTMIAVLLKLLGVSDEIIAADYSLSNQSYQHSRKAAHRVFESLKVFGLREEDLAYLTIADAKVMAQTLHHIDKRYGSVEAYLRNAVGLSSETLQAIRNNLLE